MVRLNIGPLKLTILIIFHSLVLFDCVISRDHDVIGDPGWIRVGINQWPDGEDQQD